MSAKLAIIACVPLLVLAVVAGVFLYSCEDDWCFVIEWQKVKAADSFERCLSLGFPVAESSPRQCKAGSRSFTEILETPENESSLPAVSSDGRIRIDLPAQNALIESPLRVSGEAKGSWYFEGTFPVRLLDANGSVLAAFPVAAKGEWMTPEFVPFEGELKFATPKTKTGILVLSKDNPSGLAEHDAFVSIQLRFAVYQGAKGPLRTILLYYYKEANDLDASGKPACTSRGLFPVERTIALSKTPITDTVKLFLAGMLTPEEEKSGITTEYPLPEFTFRSASLTRGTLTLQFDDPLNRTQGGACRSTILKSQIETTARQFSGVKDVVFVPEHLFQP